MTGNSLNILIIGGKPEDRTNLRRMLETDSARSMTVTEAQNAARAETILLSNAIDCVLLDFNLPDTTVQDFIPRIGACSLTRCTPVIFLIGKGDEAAAAQAIKKGAADYLDKSVLTGSLLVRAIKRAIDQRQAQRAVLEQNALLNTLIETIPNPIFYRDKDGVYIGCNKAFENFVGIDRQKIIGRTTLEVIRPKATQNYFAFESDLIAKGGTHYQENWLYDSRGQTRNVIVSKAGFTDAGGQIRGVVGVLVDITDLKKMEAALRKTGEELKENITKLEAANRRIIDQQNALIEEERLKVLLQMAGATAHELNQPLATLMGYIELFEFDKDDPEKVAAYLEKIKTAGHRIAEIVEKIQSMRPDQVEVKSNGVNVITIDQDVHLLVIEDQGSDYDRITEMLKHQQRFQISRARDFDDALRALEQHTYDIIILDYLLPSGNGLDLLDKLNERELETPVIFSTGHGDEMIAAKALQAGAYDYLPKSRMNRDTLLRRVAHCLEKHRLKNEVRQTMKKMADMSVLDELTGLHNRRYMNELLDREFSRAQRYGNDLSCLLIDVDFFKQINDSFGHIFGDFVLKQFSACLKRNVRESDFCFRYGGEEFLVLLPNTDIEGAGNTAEKLRSFVEDQAFAYEDFSARITISIGGVSLKRHRPKAIKDMLAFADKALYRAKSEGRNRIVIYMDNAQAVNPDNEMDVDIVFFKEQLSAILEKNKTAALNALSLLLNQLGAEKYMPHHQKALVQIDLMARQLSLPVDLVDSIKRAAMFHDQLKVLLPQALLNKSGPLSSEERSFMEDHATMLADLTCSFELFRNEREILLHHQERYDGSGYPSGLNGENIPLGARIFAIVDAVAAMMSERPYRNALDGEQVVTELTENAGTQFDPELVKIFIDTLENNPQLQLSAEFITKQTQWKIKLEQGDTHTEAYTDE